MSSSSPANKPETRLILNDALGVDSSDNEAPLISSNNNNIIAACSPVLPDTLIYNISLAAEEDENDTIKKIDAILEQGKDIYDDHVTTDHGLVDNLLSNTNSNDYTLRTECVKEEIFIGMFYFCFLHFVRVIFFPFLHNY